MPKTNRPVDDGAPKENVLERFGVKYGPAPLEIKDGPFFEVVDEKTDVLSVVAVLSTAVVVVLLVVKGKELKGY